MSIEFKEYKITNIKPVIPHIVNQRVEYYTADGAFHVQYFLGAQIEKIIECIGPTKRNSTITIYEMETTNIISID